MVERYKKKGVDISWMLKGKPHIRDRYEEVGFDPDSQMVNIHGAQFPSGQVPGTSLIEGRHHIGDPMSLAEALERQVGHDVPVKLTPEEREQAERQRVIDESWMSEGAQTMYQGVKGAMQEPISFPYAPGAPTKATTSIEEELESTEETEEEKDDEVSWDHEYLEQPGEYIKWGEASKVIPRGSTFTIIDVRTGRSWQAKRYGGTLHADVEPLTARDAAALKESVGHSWARRPIIVYIDGRYIAASMNSMPHAGQSIRNNNFNGHHCIHFVGSKVHRSGNVCSQHQNAIKAAAGLA